MRERVNLTQTQAAEALGVTRTTWQNYESGRAAVLKIDLQDRIAAALGGSRADLQQAADQGTKYAMPVMMQALGGVQEEGVDFEVAPDLRRAVFPLEEGEVTISFPANLSPDGMRELAAYLDIFLKRSAG